MGQKCCLFCTEKFFAPPSFHLFKVKTKKERRDRNSKSPNFSFQEKNRIPMRGTAAPKRPSPTKGVLTSVRNIFSNVRQVDRDNLGVGHGEAVGRRGRVHAVEVAPDVALRSVHALFGI
jgi:hypothetical protein